MNSRFAALVLTLAALGTAVETAEAQEPKSQPLPSLPQRIYANTTEVESMALAGTTLWVATRGGLEQYDTRSLARTAHYTTLDGLPSLFINSVTVGPDGTVTAQSGKQQCVLSASRQARRFACSTKSGAAALPQAHAPVDHTLVEGAAVTVRLQDGAGPSYYGTAGRGVWRLHQKHWQRLTPLGQLCSNHIVAMTEYGGSSWFASFDRGLCRLDGEHFVDAALAAPLLNDVLGTDQGLFVASSQGLFRSEDGVHFEREERVVEHSINDLAYDAKRQLLYATATNSLWQLALGKGRHSVRAWYQPGGSRSLQAVDVGPDGEVWLASEDRGVMRKTGSRKFVVYDRLAGLPSSWDVDVLAMGGKRALGASLDHGVMMVGAAAVPRAVPTPDAWMLFLGRDAGAEDAVFVGTQGGGAVIRGQQGENERFQGLPDSRVHAIARLASGLWVATEGGVARY
jgi:ligand-binding sensor domain-containing protein